MECQAMFPDSYNPSLCDTQSILFP